jgi:DNA-binding NarL/FixJ family response regulator
MNHEDALKKKNAVRVLIVEDFELWRRFILALIRQNPDYEVVGVAADGLEGVKQAQALQPDVILVDVGLPTLNGIEMVRRIRKICPECRIIFLTENAEPAVVRAAFGIGAHGYILKSDADLDLPLGMKAALNRKQFLSRRVRNINFTSVGNGEDKQAQRIP